MQFKSYNKIHRLGKDETDGILTGTVYVQEKIDGANASIWMEDGVVHCGSRTQDVTEKPFNGFPEYVKAHHGINTYLSAEPNHRLYGEWLVKHTIGYNETSYRKFYLYEIHIDDQGTLMNMIDMYSVAKFYEIPTAEWLGEYINPTVEEMHEHVGKSVLGQKGEVVVIKNLGFRNKFGDPCHAKIVTQEFKEDNGVTFGGNDKHSETYEEMYVCNKYITLERVKKIMQKLESTDGRLELKDIPRVSSIVYHDMLSEEIWEIAKSKMVIDFKALQTLCMKKAVFIFKDILENPENVSVAYQSL